MFSRMALNRLQNSVKGYSARGGAEISKRLGDNGKLVLRQPALLSKERNKTRIGLVGGQTSKRRAVNAAAKFDLADHFFQSGDGRSRERFAIKVHVEVPVRRILHADRARILTRTAKEKFSESVSVSRRGAVLCAQEKRTGTVAEQAAEFSRDLAWPESTAMNIRSNDSDGASLSRSDESLGYSEPVYEAETSAADVQRATVLASKELGVKLRGEGRIAAMRFAGGDDPIQFWNASFRDLESLLRGARTKCEFIFIFSGVRKGFDSGPGAKLSKRHMEGPVDFLGRNLQGADHR